MRLSSASMAAMSAARFRPRPLLPRRPGQPVHNEWPLRNDLELGALPGAVPCARLHARNMLWEWGLDHLAETVELLVSELMTNGIKASRAMHHVPPVGLRISSDRTRVLIEVRDGNPHPPVPVQTDSTSEYGRGLLLVETLSERWDWHRAQGGKVVWAIIRLHG